MLDLHDSLSAVQLLSLSQLLYVVFKLHPLGSVALSLIIWYIYIHRESNFKFEKGVNSWLFKISAAITWVGMRRAINALIPGAILASCSPFSLPHFRSGPINRHAPRRSFLWAVNWPRSLPEKTQGGARIRIHHLSARIADLIYHTQQSHRKITFFIVDLTVADDTDTHDGHLTSYSPFFMPLNIYLFEELFFIIFISFYFIFSFPNNEEVSPVSGAVARPRFLVRTHSPSSSLMQRQTTGRDLQYWSIAVQYRLYI